MAYDGSIKIDTSINTDGFKSGLNNISSMADKTVKNVANSVTNTSDKTSDSLKNEFSKTSSLADKSAKDVTNSVTDAAGTKSTVALSLSQIAHGVLTKQITFATAAQTIFNAVLNANPIGIVVTAVALLTAGIALLCAANNDNKESLEKANACAGTMADRFIAFVKMLYCASAYGWCIESPREGFYSNFSSI